jgi:hypothetical protein
MNSWQKKVTQILNVRIGQLNNHIGRKQQAIDSEECVIDQKRREGNIRLHIYLFIVLCVYMYISVLS